MSVELPAYTPRTKAENQGGGVRVDLGVAALATLSPGEKIPSPKLLQASLRKLQCLSLGLSRKVLESQSERLSRKGCKEAHDFSRWMNCRKSVSDLDS